MRYMVLLTSRQIDAVMMMCDYARSRDLIPSDAVRDLSRLMRDAREAADKVGMLISCVVSQ